MRFSPIPLALILALASCVAPPRTAPVRQPAPAPAPIPTAAPPPQSADWRDWAMTPGAWRYGQDGATSTARFGMAGAAPLVTIRCDPSVRRLTFLVAGARRGGQMTVRTSFGTAGWPLQATTTATATTGPFVAARSAGDATLDQIAFSRGRFTLEVPGTAPLVLPAWAEIARVIEDCRG